MSTATEDQLTASYAEFRALYQPIVPTDAEVSQVKTQFIQLFESMGVEPFEQSDEEIRGLIVSGNAFEAWEREETDRSGKLLQFPQ